MNLRNTLVVITFFFSKFIRIIVYIYIVRDVAICSVGRRATTIELTSLLVMASVKHYIRVMGL